MAELMVVEEREEEDEEDATAEAAPIERLREYLAQDEDE